MNAQNFPNLHPQIDSDWISRICNIQFKWGGWGKPEYGFDCIGLADYVRRMDGELGFDKSKIDWIYSRYPTHDRAPANLIPVIAEQVAIPREIPQHLDLILLRSISGVVCLGTYVLRNDKQPAIVFINERGIVCRMDRLLRRFAIHSIVYPEKLILL
jgi:hypothetical protein